MSIAKKERMSLHDPSLPISGLDDTPLPTTRDVARRFQRDGIDGLPTAIRRGDDATYQEVACRSALNRVEGMPFRWTLNPYRGCTHGCHYCFARRYQTQLEMGAGDDFSSVILVKRNFPEVLRREMRRHGNRGRIALGTATDPYQPAEGHYRLTRRTLEVLIDHPAPVGLLTKGPLIVRDADLLAELSRRTECTVHVSIPTVDEEAWRRLEPATAHPRQRLRAVRTLVDAGVSAGVLMAPIVPGISSHPAKLEATIRAIADHGAAFVGSIVLHLEGGSRAHFFEFLQREFPDLVGGYRRLYAGKYPTRRYAGRVKSTLGMLQAKYGMASSGSPLPSRGNRAGAPPVPRQVALRGL